MYSEKPVRALAKAVSWRIGGATITITGLFLYTGDLNFSLSAGGAVEVVKVGIYYVHERVWDRIKFGRTKAPEYTI